MATKAVVAIDSDMIFLNTFRRVLTHADVLPSYEYVPILVEQASPEAVVVFCEDKLRAQQALSRDAVIVFVDIVIVERAEPPVDRSGLLVARRLREILPRIPIVGITRFIKEHRLLSEISFDRTYRIRQTVICPPTTRQSHQKGSPPFLERPKRLSGSPPGLDLPD